MQSNKLNSFATDRISRFAPEIYDALYAQFDQYNEVLANICATVVILKDVNNLVELGSGSGLFAKSLIKAFQPREFTGIDPNTLMIEKAKARLNLVNATLYCDTAQNLSRYFQPATIDVIAIKSAFHHFKETVSLDSLLDFLSDRGRLIVVERTPRSAASYPIFDEARDHWEAYFARQSSTSMADYSAFVARLVYGEYVRVRSKEYYEAMKQGQLSFTWSFDQELVRAWALQASSTNADFVDVYEEFEVHVFSRKR